MKRVPEGEGKVRRGDRHRPFKKGIKKRSTLDPRHVVSECKYNSQRGMDDGFGFGDERTREDSNN